MNAVLAALLLTVSIQMAMSGKWVADPRAPECFSVGRSGGSGCGDGGGAKPLCLNALTIELTDNSIKIERVVNEETLTLVFPLDGSPVKHPISYCRELPQDPIMKIDRAIFMERAAAVGWDKMTSSARREGAKVIVRSHYGAQDGGADYVQAISVTLLGHLMVETTSLNGPHWSRLLYAKNRAQ
jgi:hypothetical protein